MNELTPMSHEEIEDIGASMSVSVYRHANSDTTYEETIAELNALSEAVPYKELFSEYDIAATALSSVKDKKQEIEDRLAADFSRLDSLAETFIARKPSQVESAKKLIEDKKQDASAAVAEELAELTEKQVEASQRLEAVSATVESVATPWPLPALSEEELEGFELTQEDEAIEEEVTQDSPLVVTERQPGPYAELAASIPDLMSRLKAHESMHKHVYEEIKTAKEVLAEASAKPESERSELENNLMKAVWVLHRRYLADSTKFLSVYAPEDIIELTQRLHKFRGKNRPDFDELEGRILDKAAAPISLRSGRNLPGDLTGAIGRMHKDNPGRTGMTWQTLLTQANRACDTMRQRIEIAGGAKNVYLKDYAIEVKDLSGTKPDLSWIYQFIADEFTFDVIAARRDESQRINMERFIENCDVIETWLTETKDKLDQLPATLRLPFSRKLRRRSYSITPNSNKSAAYENISARTSILGSIKDIQARRDSAPNGTYVRRQKPAVLDPAQAISHQLRLAHNVISLKAELTYHGVAPEGFTEEITPFD